MRKIIQPRLSENVIAQISGIPYKTVPYWYGAAARALYLDLLLPKQAEFRKELPVIVWAVRRRVFADGQKRLAARDD